MNKLGEKQPLIVYDGECPLCRNIVRGWRRFAGANVKFTPYQELEKYPLGLTEPELSESVHLIERDGEVYKGAHAIFRLLSRRWGWRWLLWLYRHLPGFAAVSEAVYRLVSRHRRLLR